MRTLTWYATYLLENKRKVSSNKYLPYLQTTSDLLHHLSYILLSSIFLCVQSYTIHLKPCQPVMEKYSCIYDSVYNKTNASTSFEVKDSTMKTHFSIKKEATTFCDMSPTLSQKPNKVMLCIDIKMKKTT